MWLAKYAFSALIPNLCYRVRSSERVLYLSFDDGPHPRTGPILDALARHEAKASFFVLGDRVAGREHLLRRIAAAGHTVGVHSYSHRSVRLLDKAQLREEHLRCTHAIQQVLPHWQPRLYRPPFGHLSRELLRYSRDAGFQVVLWSRDAHDYRAADLATIRRNLGVLRPGDIVLFHDQFRLTADYLDEMLPRCQAQGYRFEALETALQVAPAPFPEVAGECLSKDAAFPNRPGTVVGRRH